MSDKPTLAAAPDERRTALLKAALEIFARYGYRKASMDEVARAAGLSRQGLYLHFPSKELLFREVLNFLIDRTLGAGKAALTNKTRTVAENLVAAFTTMHGEYAETLGTTPHLSELLETSTQLVGTLLQDQERAFRDAVAHTLDRAGIAKQWKSCGLSARDLADLLETVAAGLKQRVLSPKEYRDRITKAVRLICGPE